MGICPRGTMLRGAVNGLPRGASAPEGRQPGGAVLAPECSTAMTAWSADCLTHNQLLGQRDGLYRDLAERTRGISDAVRRLDLRRIGAGSLAGLWKRTAGWCASSVIAASKLMASMKGVRRSGACTGHPTFEALLNFEWWRGARRKRRTGKTWS
jgi:hypothetical protein